MRVVSLLPSATEVLVASSDSLDDDIVLVGRSHECDYPPYVTKHPILTSAKNKFESCAQMNEAVGTSLASGESLYDVDAKLLEELRPDVIITQDLCNVCSVDLSQVQRVCQKMGNNPKIVSLNPFTLEDVLDDIVTVGVATGREGSALRAVEGLKSRIAAASKVGEDAASQRGRQLKVAILEWIEPIFPGGHWTPQIVQLAGAEHPLNPVRPGKGAKPSFAVENEALVDADCDWIVLCPCGLDLLQTDKEVKAINQQPWWQDLRAVREGRVVSVDGSQHFNRPGPRLVDALEWLTGLINDRTDIIPPDFPWKWLKTP